MPHSFKLKAGDEIDILGVVIRAEKNSQLSINDFDYRFIPPSPGNIRRIVKAEADE